jgi:hypothetical protein
MKITLAAGARLDVLDKQLKAAQKFGLVKLQPIPGRVGWGWAYYNGQRIGRAPAEPGAPKTVRLPIGTVNLRFVNDQATPPFEWSSSCEVTEAGPSTCTIKIP